MICDLLRIIRFFYAAPGDVQKRGAKVASLSVVWFWVVRADHRNRRFARNRQAFTGRFEKNEDLPVRIIDTMLCKDGLEAAEK